MHKDDSDPPVSQGYINGLQRDKAFRLLVDSVQDYAIFILDVDGRVSTWNAGAQRIKGYSAEEIVGKHFSQFYLPEAKESKWPERELEFATAEGRFSDEGWRVRKDGTTFWASVVITALRDNKGELYGFAKVTRDLTERRDREEKIQRLNSELRNRVAQLSESQKLVEARTIELQNLSGRLMQMQDEERRRIARDLHDSLGQELAVLKMTLAAPKNSSGDLTEAVRQAIEQTDRVIKSVRSMSYLLHPPLLDEAGLMAALHWLVEGVEKRIGLQIQLVTKPASSFEGH
jgi:PAS domain S-box-containing protein